MKKTIFGLLALMVVGLIATTGLVSAYRGDYDVKGPEYNEERHVEMEKALESNDYAAWKALMTETGKQPRVLDMVNEDNFATFIAAHVAAEEGDFETAATLRAQLGLNNGNGPRDGTGFGKNQGSGMGQGKDQRSGAGQRMQQNEFVDSNNDGNYDNTGSMQGRGRR